MWLYTFHAGGWIPGVAWSPGCCLTSLEGGTRAHITAIESRAGQGYTGEGAAGRERTDSTYPLEGRDEEAVSEGIKESDIYPTL